MEKDSHDTREGEDDVNINTVTTRAIELCEPTPNEVKQITTIADQAMNLVTDYISSNPKIVEVVFGGSYAKGTWLKGDADIDIFVKMDLSVSIEDFERIGIEVGLHSLKKYKHYLRYSDHPYVEGFIDGVRVNVVPCYNVEKGKWKSAADRSTFHTEYVRNNLDDLKKREVRLLKKFLKSIGVYGAEIGIAGFSGYVAEVLVLKYGSFEGVLRAISDIREKHIVSIDKEYDSDVVKGFQSVIVILDPVDARRNLGAAISSEGVGKFVLASRAFLEAPSLSFFKDKDNDKDEKKNMRVQNKKSKSLYQNLLIVEFDYRQRSPDIIWGQLKRSLGAIITQLEMAGFTIIRATCNTDEKTSGAFLFLLESTVLPTYFQRRGPTVFRKEDAASFIKTSSSVKKALITWIDKDLRITTLVKRKDTGAKDFLRSLLLTSRIENSGVTKGLVADLQAKAKRRGKRLQIYTANERRIKGIVQEAMHELTTTESRIFR